MRKNCLPFLTILIWITSCSQSEMEPAINVDGTTYTAKMKKERISDVKSLSVKNIVYNSTGCTPDPLGWVIKYVYNDCEIIYTYNSSCLLMDQLSTCDAPDPNRVLIRIESGPKNNGSGGGDEPDDQDKEE